MVGCINKPYHLDQVCDSLAIAFIQQKDYENLVPLCSSDLDLNLQLTF